MCETVFCHIKIANALYDELFANGTIIQAFSLSLYGN